MRKLKFIARMRHFELVSPMSRILRRLHQVSKKSLRLTQPFEKVKKEKKKEFQFVPGRGPMLSQWPLLLTWFNLNPNMNE